MDDQSRMMHYQQQPYGGMAMPDATGQPSPAGVGQDDVQQQQQQQQQETGTRGHADINTILDQIMNITDQSLDEAQVSFLLILLYQTLYPTVCKN